MKKFIPLAAVLVFITLGTNCILFVEVDTTTIQVQNAMKNKTIVVNGDTYSISRIDLYGVAIDDLYFDNIPAGTTTAEIETDASGDVDIFIDSAVAYFNVNPFTVEIHRLPNVDIFTTNIAHGSTNTVTFDASNASTIIKEYYY